MVSKTFICLALFAMVAVCLSAPPQNKRRSSNMEKERAMDCSTNSDSSSSEDKPCDFTQSIVGHGKGKGKGLKMQDTSASEEWGKKMKIKMSGEDKTSMELRKAPEHQRMTENRNSPDYAHGMKMRQNVQRSRDNQDTDSNENQFQSQFQKNQINRQNKY